MTNGCPISQHNQNSGIMTDDKEDLDISIDIPSANGAPPSPISSSDSSSGADICRDFLRNVCKRGARCKFRHPTVEDQDHKMAKWSKCEPTFCHDYQNTGCRRLACRFIHCSREDEEKCKQTGKVPVALLVAAANGHGQLNGTTLGHQNYGDQDPNTPNAVGLPVCKDFLKGSCKRGAKCRFRHITQSELERVEWQAQQQQTVPGRVVQHPAPLIAGQSQTVTAAPAPPPALYPVQQQQQQRVVAAQQQQTAAAVAAVQQHQAAAQQHSLAAAHITVQLQQQGHVPAAAGPPPTAPPNAAAFAAVNPQIQQSNACLAPTAPQLYSSSNGPTYYATGQTDQQAILPLTTAPQPLPCAPSVVSLAATEVVGRPTVVPLVSNPSNAPASVLSVTSSSANCSISMTSSSSSSTPLVLITSKSDRQMTLPVVTCQNITPQDSNCDPSNFSAHHKRPRYHNMSTGQPPVLWPSAANDTGGRSIDVTASHQATVQHQSGLVTAAPGPLPDYHMLMEEITLLRRNIEELRKQNSDLQAANEVLLDQNARLRNSKQQAAAPPPPAQLFHAQQLSSGAPGIESHVMAAPSLSSSVSVVSALAPVQPQPALMTAAIMPQRPLTEVTAISGYEAMSMPSSCPSIVNTVALPIVSHSQPPPAPHPPSSQAIALSGPPQNGLIAFPLAS